MKVDYDAEADALYFTLREARIRESDEVRPGVIADYGDDGGMVGFEVLSASKVMEQFALSGFGTPAALMPPRAAGRPAGIWQKIKLGAPRALDAMRGVMNAAAPIQTQDDSIALRADFFKVLGHPLPDARYSSAEKWNRGREESYDDLASKMMR